MSSEFREVQIPVPFGAICGKWYGPTNVRPILFIHGFNDNSGSFNRLIPLLPACGSYLAIDLPGHGLSSRLPNGLMYHLHDLALYILRIMKLYGWAKVSLVGHSLGAMMCFMFAGMFSDLVDIFIALDALQPSLPGDSYKQLAYYMQRALRYDDANVQNAAPVDLTYEHMVNRTRSSAGTEIPKQLCHHLLERNIRESTLVPGKYHYVYDNRTKYPNFTGWSRETNLETARAISFPVLVIKATESVLYGDEKEYAELVELLQENNPRSKQVLVSGNHYMHLIEPERVAAVIGEFLTECEYFKDSGVSKL